MEEAGRDKDEETVDFRSRQSLSDSPLSLPNPYGYNKDRRPDVLDETDYQEMWMSTSWDPI